MGLSAEELDNLRVASLLHDIGKIATPEKILQKTGPLDSDEWQQIENHAGLGSKLLDRVQKMSSIIPGIRHHHERFDGRGYPGGLSGKNIPLLARIIAIADAYDAMTNRRSYHQPKETSEALQELKRCAGTQFDPDLIQCFVELIEELERNKEAA